LHCFDGSVDVEVDTGCEDAGCVDGSHAWIVFFSLWRSNFEPLSAADKTSFSCLAIFLDSYKVGFWMDRIRCLGRCYKFLVSDMLEKGLAMSEPS